MEIFRTLGRGSKTHFTGQHEVLLSGIVCVTLNQKAPQPKFVEITHNSTEKKTALYIHKTRMKKRTEAAIDLTQSTVFVEYDKANVVGIVNRENRIYTLKLDKDKEELERFLAQWRSVLTVSQHPDDMFSVITVSGSDRGSVILITAHDTEPAIVFKHLSGREKNKEYRLAQFIKVDKLTAYEVSLEALSGESYHFITKRPDALIRKLESRQVAEDLSQSLPTKSHDNNTDQYASRQGYTPAFMSAREVAHVPVDYLSMNDLNTRQQPAQPPPRPNVRPPAPMPYSRTPVDPSQPSPERPPERPPPPSPVPPRRPAPRVQSGPDYSFPTSTGGRIPTPDYIPMDHPSSGFETQDDYLCMDQMTIKTDPDYLIMDKGYQDPLIADYLTMDDIDMDQNRQKFDDYPTNDRPTDSNIAFDDDDDIYFDPSLAPPPVPVRLDNKPPTPPPPPRTENSSYLSAEVEIKPRPDTSPSRHPPPPSRDPPSRDPLTRDPPTRDPPTRDPPSRDPPTRDPPTRDPPSRDPPTRDPPSRDPPTPARDPLAPSRDPPTLQTPSRPVRRVSEQPHHLPRPRSNYLDDCSVTVSPVEPALPPRTDRDQLRPKVIKVEKKGKKKKGDKKAQRPRSAIVYPSEVSLSDVRTAATNNVYFPQGPIRSPLPQRGGFGEGPSPPPLAPRRM
ncbi:uncharacterized protein LOC134819166 isoform X2 [Bolinopsis microptera]|uniref:uncharacterized protein LOC134819166 isoform X2 n=1 Tax=Bolinopsis microptera TaxID=2820187 RepID=UPI00307A55F3